MSSLLVAVALALLVIYAGVKLLIQVNREALGNLYRLAAWGLIIAGKLLILFIVLAGIIVTCRHGIKVHKGKMKNKCEDCSRMNDRKMHEHMMQQGAHGGMCSGMCSMGGGKMGGMGGCKMGGACGMMGSCKMNDGDGGKPCGPNMMMSCCADSMKRRK